MSKVNHAAVHSWITRAALKYPKTLSRELSSRFGIGPTAAANVLRKLTNDKWLIRHGTNRPTYEPGTNRWLSLRVPLPIKDEDIVWTKEFTPYLSLLPNASSLASYCFTEIANNASEHSGGTVANFFVVQDENKTTINITDDGMGIFRKIAMSFNLDDMRFALLELSKGKLTTDPDNHTGEGIFFSSRMCDSFIITANGLQFFHSDTSTLDLLEDQIVVDQVGTSVWMRIQRDTSRTTKQVLDSFASSGQSFDFARTIVPVKLATIGSERLVSRSQAKRLTANLDKVKIVALDFTGIQEIGQGFADQVFRVFARAHPDIQLHVQNATTDVEQMITRAKSSAAGSSEDR